jgi:sigma-54-dependent transcriptional regulator
VRLSAGARERLRSYSWPGNVRQLKALVRRVVILAGSGGEIGEHDLDLDEARVPTTLGEELEQAERARIVEALAQARGSKTVEVKT